MNNKKQIKILTMKDPITKHGIEKDLICSLPARMIILGKSGSGKTNLLGLMVIDPENQFYGQDFIKGENIYIFSGSLKTDHKIKSIIEAKDIPSSNVFDDYDNDVLGVIYEMIEDNIKEAKAEKKKPVHSLVILDDLSFSKKIRESKTNNIAKIYQNGRKNLISIITVAQTYTSLITPIRENANCIIAYNMSGRQLEQVQNENDYGDNKKKFIRMFRRNVIESHDFMVINYTNKFKDMYLDKEFKTLDINSYDK